MHIFFLLQISMNVSVYHVKTVVHVLIVSIHIGAYVPKALVE